MCYTSIGGEVTNNMVRTFTDIAKALGDPARVRALLALRGGELCLCHFIALLELSPSTVSKHLDILYQTGLVERRKEGRWCYFRLPGRAAPPAVRGALRWIESASAEAPQAAEDAARIARLRRTDVKELACCYKAT